MKLVLILILTLCNPGSALAASNTTWVASNGANNAVCSRALPCSTFAIALAATNADGSVTIRDLTIHVSSLDSTGILIPGGDVHLENIAIVGQPLFGVDADGSANPVHLTAKNVTVVNAGTGIHIYRASASVGDSVIRGGYAGIYVHSAPGLGKRMV